MAESTQKEILISLQSILDEAVANGVPGISAAIHTRQGQQDFSAGHSDLSTQAPIDKDAAFGVGSITKLFVAVVILQLIEEQKIALDGQAISILGPGIVDGIPHASEASIGSLLSHTSGIPSWEDDPTWIKDGRGENVKPEKTWGKAETLDYVKRPGVTGFPVGKFNYANTNYTILGLIIEQVTRNTAESEIRRRILQPLGMSRTYLEGFEQPSSDRTTRRYHWATDTFRSTAGISPRVTQVRDDLVDVSGTNLSVSWTAGGMISTPTDLLKFAGALQNGRLLKESSLRTFMEWHEADETKDMGHGIFVLKRPSLPGTWIGHNGAVLGFNAGLWWNTDGSCAVAICSNAGVSHAGVVPSSAARVVGATEFLELAAKLTPA